ncbi:MAG: hypothetical protein FWB85_06310 [Chitinispirillia bacterium]|nr:hypothetical protein [Chitinispirillia bacterium]
MSNVAQYSYALNRLNYTISGSSDFEKIAHVVIKYMYPKYDFKISEGGRGTQDGGYDGYDQAKKAKLACSTQIDYGRKIEEEVKKSKKNGDRIIFYLSTREISEPDKNSIKTKYLDTDIDDIYIFGIDELSRKLEDMFKEKYSPELYDLLGLSFLNVGPRYERSEAKPYKITFSGNIYKKRMVICEGDVAKVITGDNPLLDFVINYCTENKVDSFKNIILCGLGYLGKSFLMKTTFNRLIEEFSDKNNYCKYKFLPFIQFYELKHYSPMQISNDIKNPFEPLIIFLDGFDELNESKKIVLNNEIQNILNSNNCVRFIISGRNSSFDIDIFSDKIQLNLEKCYDYNDIEFMRLREEYKDTPIADLLPIPMYRKFIQERRISKNSTLEEFYSLLIEERLLDDKKRADFSHGILTRGTSRIDITEFIAKISDFCYCLFIDKKNVFTEDELKKHFNDVNLFNFAIGLPIIDYQDVGNISFISNFYYEYFISNILLTQNKCTVCSNLFIRGKVRISSIDILVLYMSRVKIKSKKIYDYFMNKMCKYDIACILLCEFDSITDAERYAYFISIYEEYKKGKKQIFYIRFRRIYGPLKNVDNMAQRMQQLLPNSKKQDALKFLKAEIDKYLSHPSTDDSLAFANAVILLIPRIDDLWGKEEQAILKEMSIPLIKFLIYHDLSSEVKNILSVEYIFNYWYKAYDWTTDWDQDHWEKFCENISSGICTLFSEIANEREFTIKFNFFSYFHDHGCIRSLLLPVFRYAIKNKYIDDNIATTVPGIINDDFETPVVYVDHRSYILSDILKKINLTVAEILSLLVFAAKNDLYRPLHNRHDSPIKVLEERLFPSIGLMDDNECEMFSQCYLHVNKFGVIDDFEYIRKLFAKEQKQKFEKIKKVLVREIINKKTKPMWVSNMLANLINFVNAELSSEYLCMIKENMPEDVYSSTMHHIYHNKEHIINNSEIVIKEYRILFKKEFSKETERKDQLKQIKESIELIKKNELTLMSNHEIMIEQLKKINAFISTYTVSNKDETSFGKLCFLNHQCIINEVSFGDISNIPPIFSEYAIEIMKGFYRDDIFDIDIIIAKLQDYWFKEENFYIYFYWCFIDKLGNQNDGIIYDGDIKQKILNSIDIGVSKIFLNNSIEKFNFSDHWLTPFLYYYDMLLKKTPPRWMRLEHILKLIVVPYPDKHATSTDADTSFNWLSKNFPVTPYQIVEYGLKIIDNISHRYSRMQITRYFIDYYNSNAPDAITDDILNFIINSTQRMFDLSPSNDRSAEFQYIGCFWRGCTSNHINRLFPKFAAKIIISAMEINNNDIVVHYRKNVLLYCAKLATIEQKEKIIREIETDLLNRALSNTEKVEVHNFLSSLGREDSIKFIINLYLNGKAVENRNFFDSYSFGYIKQNQEILKNYIKLFIYSTEKNSERRRILKEIARNGIKQHLTKNNFKIFEKRMCCEIKKYKKQSSWMWWYYEEYLLEMEQLVYS